MRLWRRWKKVFPYFSTCNWWYFLIWCRLIIFHKLTSFTFLFVCHIYDCFIFYFWLRSSELMLLGFISLLLTATSSTIANICIPSKFYDSTFAPCTRSEIDEELEDDSSKERKLLVASSFHLFRRMLNGMNRNTCKEARDWSIFWLQSLLF